MRDPLQPELLKKAAAHSLFSTNIVYRDILDSTNTLAKDLAMQGAAEGTVVIAEEQTSGRGRRGRTWLSPGRTNLLLSILLRPAFTPEKVFSLTMVLAIAALEIIKKETGLSCMIKWPNDLYVGSKKIAGILTEFSVRDKMVEWVILGLGLNVNWYPEEGNEISRLATSILAETGVKLSRNELAVDILKEFEGFYSRVRAGRGEELYRKWNDSSLVLGKQVVIEAEQKRITGKAVRVDEDGALIIEDLQGKQQRIMSGDVSLTIEKRT